MDKIIMAGGYHVQVEYEYHPDFGIVINSWQALVDEIEIEILSREVSEEIERDVFEWAEREDLGYYEELWMASHDDFKYDCWKDDELCSR